MLYIGASLKEFIIKSRQNEYRMVERSNNNGLNLRL